jgi:predicted nucleic acid-binding protein
MIFVLDNSVAMRWLLPNTRPADTEYAAMALEALVDHQALVPTLWPLEVANVISKAESKGWVTEARSQTFLSLLASLNIVEDKATADRTLGQTLNLSRRTKLSAYDAAYLELAMRRGLPLATLDTDLATAAIALGVPIFRTS